MYGESRTLAASGASFTDSFGPYAAHVYVLHAPAPAAPSSLTARAVGNGRVQLSWRDNATSETGFAVERATGTGAFVEIARLGANATGYTDGDLVKQQTYTYRVKAFNTAGDSAYSNTARVRAK